MTLQDIPRGSRLRVHVEGEPEMSNGTFHHLDGSYSLCTLDDGRIFHLYHAQEMRKVSAPAGDPAGDHYELAWPGGVN